MPPELVDSSMELCRVSGSSACAPCIAREVVDLARYRVDDRGILRIAYSPRITRAQAPPKMRHPPPQEFFDEFPLEDFSARHRASGYPRHIPVQ